MIKSFGDLIKKFMQKFPDLNEFETERLLTEYLLEKYPQINNETKIVLAIEDSFFIEKCNSWNDFIKTPGCGFLEKIQRIFGELMPFKNDWGYIKLLSIYKEEIKLELCLSNTSYDLDNKKMMPVSYKREIRLKCAYHAETDTLYYKDFSVKKHNESDFNFNDLKI